MSIKAEDVCKPSQTVTSVHAEKVKPSRKRPIKEKVVLSWSGGKDSTMTAYHLLASQKYEIAALLTTVTEEFDRISMHGVRASTGRYRASRRQCTRTTPGPSNSIDLTT